MENTKRLCNLFDNEDRNRNLYYAREDPVSID